MLVFPPPTIPFYSDGRLPKPAPFLGKRLPLTLGLLQILAFPLNHLGGCLLCETLISELPLCTLDLVLQPLN